MRTSTFLWFDGHAEQAAEHYVALFPDSEILDRRPGRDGTTATITFRLGGQRFIAHNGGPQFTFTPAISLFVDCDTQDEVDRLWTGLTDGGTEGPGGSLTDRFGISWQVIPRQLDDLLADTAPEVAQRVLNAVHTMNKIDIGQLAAARDR